MKKFFVMMLSSIIICSMLSTVALADSAETNNSVDNVYTSDTAGNVFSAGTVANVNNEDALDIFAAGNSVNVTKSNVGGNIFAAGNQVGISEIDGNASLFMAGNVVSISNYSANGNIFAVGNQIAVNDASAASIKAAASVLNVQGNFNSVALSGENISFDGYVDGDVTLEGNTVSISDDSVVTGKLIVKAPVEPILGNAQIGEYVYEEITEAEADLEQGKVKVNIFGRALNKLAGRVYWIIALAIVGLLLSLFFGPALDEAKDMISERTSSMIVGGVIAWVAVPVAVILLFITVVGAPAGAFLLLGYIFMIAVGTSFTGASVGRLVLHNMNKYIASIIGIAVLVVINIIPIIGFLTSIAADMYLLGYVIQKISMNMNKKNELVEIP